MNDSTVAVHTYEEVKGSWGKVYMSVCGRGVGLSDTER